MGATTSDVRIVEPRGARDASFLRVALHGRLLLGLGLLLAGLMGCQTSRAGFHLWNPLGLKLPFSPKERPVRIAVAAAREGMFAPENWARTFQTPWSPLCEELSRQLDKPVQIEPMPSDQIAYHLQSGRFQFALVSKEEVPGMKERCPAIETLAEGETYQPRGVMVADASSPIRTFADLKGRRFAFGPLGSELLDVEAKKALKREGVSPDELRKEFFPVPGSFQYHINSAEVAKELVLGIQGADAGVIEEDFYVGLADKGGGFTWTGYRFAKEQFRILGYTDALDMKGLPGCTLVSTAGVDGEMRRRVAAFFIEVDQKKPEVIHKLGVARFRAAAEEGDVNRGEKQASRS